MSKVSRLKKIYSTLFSLAVVTAVAFSQFPIKIPKISTGNPFEKEPPLTTSLADALTEVPFLDDFEPTDAAPLALLPRGPNNGFLIGNPGAYMFSAQSYCFHAGTHSPGKGKGYLYAPLRGRDAEIIRNVLRRSVNYPNVPQPDVQALVWAILAQTKPSAMNQRIGATAKLLLTKPEIDKLEGSAFEEVSQDLFSRALGKLPPQTQRVFEAERQLRSAVSGNVSYNELERIAVLTGEPVPGKDDRLVPSGRWSYHPEGYFIRYYPQGYQTTQLDVYFPEDITVERDAGRRITALGWKNGRRLAIDYDDARPPLSVNKENSLKGYAFRSVRLELTVRQPEKSRYRGEIGTVTVAEWKNGGWTFAGASEGKGKAADDALYPNAAARYDTARRQSDDLRKLLKNIEKFDKNKKVGAFAAAETADLLGLMQLSVALKELLGANRDALLFDPVELAQRAWAAEFRKLVAAHEFSAVRRPPGTLFDQGIFAFAPLENNRPATIPEFNSENGAASPGETGRQRLGISPRESTKDEQCKSEFKDCQSEAGSDYLACFAACGANLPPKPTLGQLNDARKCFSSCESNYSQQNRQCSRTAKICLKN